MTAWSIWLAVLSGMLGLGALVFTWLGYRSARDEMQAPPAYDDITEIRKTIGSFIFGAKVWQTYLAVALTAGSVVLGAASNIVGALA